MFLILFAFCAYLSLRIPTWRRSRSLHGDRLFLKISYLIIQTILKPWSLACWLRIYFPFVQNTIILWLMMYSSLTLCELVCIHPLMNWNRPIYLIMSSFYAFNSHFYWNNAFFSCFRVVSCSICNSLQLLSVEKFRCN